MMEKVAEKNRVAEEVRQWKNNNDAAGKLMSSVQQRTLQQEYLKFLDGLARKYRDGDTPGEKVWMSYVKQERFELEKKQTRWEFFKRTFHKLELPRRLGRIYGQAFPERNMPKIHKFFKDLWDGVKTDAAAGARDLKRLVSIEKKVAQKHGQPPKVKAKQSKPYVAGLSSLRKTILTLPLSKRTTLQVKNAIIKQLSSGKTVPVTLQKGRKTMDVNLRVGPSGKVAFANREGTAISSKQIDSFLNPSKEMTEKVGQDKKQERSAKIKLRA